MLKQRLCLWVTLVGLLLCSGHLLGQSNEIILTVALEDWRSDMLTERVLADFYETHPGVKVVAAPLNSDNLYYAFNITDAEQALDAAKDIFSSGDIVIAHEYDLGVLATRAGYVLDLQPYARADSSSDLDDFYPVALQAFEWDNGLWALPAGLHGMYMAYDPRAFDAANYPYPKSSWTLDQYFEAGRVLTTRDADGAMLVPGFAAYDERILLRGFYGHGIFDTSTQPETPHLTDPDLIALMEQMSAYGRELAGDHPYPEDVNWSQVPIQMGDIQLFSKPETQHFVPVLFPGNTGYVSAEGFAVSAGTPYPDLAYDLVKYLTGKIDVVTRFYAELPARRSLDGQSTSKPRKGEISYVPLAIPPSVKSVAPQLLETGFSNSELRYLNYTFFARGKMWEDDSLSVENALQLAQEQALDHIALAEKRQTDDLVITRPVPTAAPEPDQITLSFGLVSQISPLPNPADWERVAQDFAASDSEVGRVNIAEGTSITADGPDLDCAYTFYNAIPVMDLSLIQPIDPFLATDARFERGDMPQVIWPQVSYEDHIYGLPLTITPLLMWYSPTRFETAGLVVPTNGWTINEFMDDLTQLKADQSDSPYRSQKARSTPYLMLAAAMGGVAIDYSTLPPTYHLTDPTVVAALRQTLDLAKEGVIAYVPLDPSSSEWQSIGETTAIYDAPTATGTIINGTTLPVSFPQGNLTPAAYSIGAATITARTPYPEACYRWLSTIAQHPELFQDMPARRSQITGEALLAAQGQNMADLYTQIFDRLNDPQTVTFPSGVGLISSPDEMPPLIWFNQALDAYVLDNRDLEQALMDAQAKIDDYRLCTAGIAPLDLAHDDASDHEQHQQQFNECAISVDPALRDRLNE